LALIQFDRAHAIQAELLLVKAELFSVTATTFPALPSRAKSLLHYAPGLVALVIVIADSAQMSDPDLWGHIRFGQAVLAEHHLITRDPYSYTAFGHQWSNHEWLTEVVMAAAYDTLGVIGLKLWKLVCVTATMLLVAMGMAEAGAAPRVQLNLFVLAAIALVPQMEFRPQLFTFALLAAMLAILARDNYRRAAPLWLLIPLMALWANLHGGFIMGIAVLALYAATATIEDFVSGAGLRHGLRLGALAFAAFVATMVTPYGLETWSPVLHALRNPMTRISVTDWQPLGFALMRQWHASHAGIIYFLCGIVMIIAFVVTFALAPRGGDLPLVAIAGVMSVAAIVAVRNLPLAIIACALPVARHWSLPIDRRRERAQAAGAKVEPMPERSATSPWIALAVAVLLAAYAGLLSPRLRNDKPYPAGAVAFMQKHNLHGNILGDFGWGEYLIWHTAPASKVFIDGRYDTVYPYAIIDQYIGFYFDLSGAPAMLTAYPHDLVLIPPTSGAYTLMAGRTEWKLIYRDTVSALFVRKTSPSAMLAAIDDAPAPNRAAKVSYFP
jgi:hypothetical protein